MFYKFTEKSNFLLGLGSLSLSFLDWFCLSLPSLSLTSRLVKTLLYNFIRQEKCPPPSPHIFEPKDEGGLLYGLASGVASKSARSHPFHGPLTPWSPRNKSTPSLPLLNSDFIYLYVDCLKVKITVRNL